jgi:hypothetical protein
MENRRNLFREETKQKNKNLKQRTLLKLLLFLLTWVRSEPYSTVWNMADKECYHKQESTGISLTTMANRKK